MTEPKFGISWETVNGSTVVEEASGKRTLLIRQSANFLIKIRFTKKLGARRRESTMLCWKLRVPFKSLDFLVLWISRVSRQCSFLAFVHEFWLKTSRCYSRETVLFSVFKKDFKIKGFGVLAAVCYFGFVVNNGSDKGSVGCV
ncbi:hypothetical protein MA16_Dca004768 [Dendrobium catenatum]|uniref:Uncharacterized protein n=1 Tax=Dendrobium catenatum TaxID=906689 RepID=A0A2I0VP20_9ASPA|nr:hypothetical protein MA16_Dca004768 [Dendrobium catenatum]